MSYFENMYVKKISELDRTQLYEVIRMYTNAFPIEERRTLQSLNSNSNSDNIDYLVFIKDNIPIAGVSIYYIQDFIFIEHLFVAEKMRGKGIGTKIIEYIIESNPLSDIILEVEPPKLSQAAKKRIKFYESLGFNVEKIRYLQPPYRENEKEIELLLMRRNGKSLNRLKLSDIVEKIKSVVYNYTTNDSK